MFTHCASGNQVTDFFEELEKTRHLEAYFRPLKEFFMEQPNEVSLETFAHCNAGCSFCPYPTLERKGTKMSDELIDRVIDEMATFVNPFYFSPFKVSEPLLDKRMQDICERAVKYTKALIRIFTNGAPLTQKHIDWIADLQRVEHLWISLNSMDPVEYKTLMGIEFEKTAKRLDNLHEQDFPHRVTLSCVGFPNEPFREACFERWPKFDSVALQRSEWLGYTHSQIDTVPDTPCGRWFELSIMASGIVSLCCMDGEGQYPLGDINNNTLLEIYNAPLLRQRREQLLSRKNYPACENCTN